MKKFNIEKTLKVTIHKVTLDLINNVEDIVVFLCLKVFIFDKSFKFSKFP